MRRKRPLHRIVARVRGGHLLGDLLLTATLGTLAAGVVLVLAG
ncbi:hypothetical protein [Alloalcanivorax xenomutans]|jgi:hypothetical protein|nr:hypothetical protein [Alloalcanivorax xenomutans]WOD29725.1 hypothetical protein RYH70_06545 [Alloalcanivorax xenomutans]CUR45332.1 hypothetical protein BN2364_0891 [Alloalcanivorax xenomutans]